MIRQRRQRGVALITAVLVVALATIAATAILSSGNLALHRAANLHETERAWWLATGVENWVRTILVRDAKNNKIDALDDVWAQPVDFLPVDQGFIRGQVVDLQGRFNLNNFATASPDRLKEYTEQFARLLEILEVDPFIAKPIAQTIRDWVDPDSSVTPNDGAEDTEYLGLQPPYRIPNRPMQSVTELMAVKGMTQQIYARLLPYVAALPQVDTPININTAPQPVLESMVIKPSSAMAQFVEERLKKPLDSTAQLTSTGIIGNAPDMATSYMTVASDFFQLRAEATIGQSRVAIYSLYYRQSSGVLVLARSTDSE